MLKSQQHRSIAQQLLGAMGHFVPRHIDMLIALTAANEEDQRFYRSVPDSELHDVGI